MIDMRFEIRDYEKKGSYKAHKDLNTKHTKKNYEL